MKRSVRKSSARKTTKGTTSKVQKKPLYQVISSYAPVVATKEAAVGLYAKIKKLPKAQMTPIKKVGNGYGFTFHFVFVTNKAAEVKKAKANLQKSKHAKVTVRRVQ